MHGQKFGRRVIEHVGKLVLISLGFGLTTVLVLSVNVRALWHDLAAVGFGLIVILALHVVVMAIDGIAWRTLLPACDRGTFALLLWARWVRESTNVLLPVAQVGGEVVATRLLVRNGVALRHATASVVVDKLAEAVTLLLFALTGLAGMVAIRGVNDLTRGIAVALAIVTTIALGAVAFQKVGGFSHLERWLSIAVRKVNAAAFREFTDIVGAIKATGRARRLAVAAALHFTGWLLGSSEVWLALRYMGHPISAPAALVIESLSSTITAAGFMVPGAIGVQEAGYMAITAALGLPAELGLAVSLVKRTRQLLLGLPALASWPAAELAWLRRSAPVPAVSRPAIKSDSR